jgi:hypothetical protein
MWVSGSVAAFATTLLGLTVIRDRREIVRPCSSGSIGLFSTV